MTNVLLIDHFPNCTPLKPCVSCKVASFLRTKLSSEDFNEIIKIIHDQVSDSTIGLDESIDKLELPIKVSMCLKAENLNTVGDILKKTELELMTLPNFGKHSLRLLRDALQESGRRIGESTK